MITFFLIIIAAALVVLGVANGEANAVFRKAATVCLDCIGLGLAGL